MHTCTVLTSSAVSKIEGVAQEVGGGMTQEVGGGHKKWEGAHKKWEGG